MEDSDSKNQSDAVEKQFNLLPLEVYDSVIRSLYGDQNTLFINTLAAWVAVIVVWFRTGSAEILVCAGVIIIVGLFRIASLVNFKKIAKQPLDVQTLQSRETIYQGWGGLYVGLLGLTCFVSLAVTSDGTAHLILIAVTLAHTIGIAGHNFASAKVIKTQVLAVGVPLISGLVLYGGMYDVFLACLLLPFLFTIQTIAYRLRQMLFNALFIAMENKTNVNRFEIALKNASHGMAMLDVNGSFMVANGRFNQLFGISESAGITGKKFKALSELEMATYAVPVGHTTLTDRLLDCIDSGRKQRFIYTRLDGLTLEVSFNPMAEGAGVLVLEDVSERVNSEKEIRQLANFDALTLLPNRRHFTEQVRISWQKKPEFNSFSVFFMDLDKFKDINDTLGHTVGDKLLCAVSMRMKSCLPDNGMICRFGGDEFVAILPGVIDETGCAGFANHIIEEVSKPLLINGNLIIVGASVGIALCPDNASNFDILLKMADVSLYEAKSKGRGGYYFYSDELGVKIEQRRKMEVDLRRAIDNGEFSIHYQPLINLKENRVVCCEALLRWDHPELGFISPSIFIPVAEEIGIISKIGKFVLVEATRECTKWPSSVSVAVNVSSLQFQQSDVCDVVTQSLIESGLNPKRLEIEVTETAMIEDLEETSRVLRELAQGGVKISLDDFGTGFSSLSYLHQLPLDKVKIDRSFVEMIRDDKRSLTLLSGITKMAADLGLVIIVEGVEEMEQLELLKREVHLDQVQGFLFSKPIAAADIGEFIANNLGAMPDSEIVENKVAQLA